MDMDAYLDIFFRGAYLDILLPFLTCLRRGNSSDCIFYARQLGLLGLRLQAYLLDMPLILKRNHFRGRSLKKTLR